MGGAKADKVATGLARKSPYSHRSEPMERVLVHILDRSSPYDLPLMAADHWGLQLLSCRCSCYVVLEC